MTHLVRYGDDPSQLAELSLPDGAGRCPVVVIVHGGAWLSEYGLEFGRPLAEDLVRSGVAVYNVEYRRVGTGRGGGGGWPATGHDVAVAVEALTEVEPRVAERLDLDRVVALGHSAGGQLLAWLAGQSESSGGSPGSRARVRLSGLVLQAAMLDLVDAARLGAADNAVPTFLAGGPCEKPHEYAEASPICYVPVRLPTVCAHGDADVIVPVSQSQRYTAAAAAAGDDVLLHIIPGADHFDPITVGTPAWDICRAEVLRLAATS